MGNNKIQVGQVWEVTTDNFFGSISSPKHGIKTERDVLIHVLKGERIEIRYPYDWHFRTEDDIYLHAYPKEILENCKLFGVIDERIRFSNKASLEEILRLELYKK